MHILKHAVKQIAMHIPHSHALSGGGRKKHYLTPNPQQAHRSLLHASTYCRQMQLCTCILAHSWGLTYVFKQDRSIHHLRLQAPSHALLATPAWEYTSYITHGEYWPQAHRCKHHHYHHQISSDIREVILAILKTYRNNGPDVSTHAIYMQTRASTMQLGMQWSKAELFKRSQALSEIYASWDCNLHKERYQKAAFWAILETDSL